MSYMPSEPVTRSGRRTPCIRAAHSTPIPSGTRRSGGEDGGEFGLRRAPTMNSGLTVQTWRQCVCAVCGVDPSRDLGKHTFGVDAVDLYAKDVDGRLG